MFEQLGLQEYLNTAGQHAILKSACDNLLNVHLAFDNFYNEPPFVQRLCELSLHMTRPETVLNEYVGTVILCYVGNRYGVSRATIPYYTIMIQNFRPKEIDKLLNALEVKRAILLDRIQSSPKCRSRYVEAVKLLDVASLDPRQFLNYSEIIKKYS